MAEKTNQHEGGRGGRGDGKYAMFREERRGERETVRGAKLKRPKAEKAGRPGNRVRGTGALAA